MPLGRWRAGRLNELGRRAEKSGLHDEAIGLYQLAAEAAPEWETPWLHLGMVHKRSRNWRECLRCSEEAARRGSSAAVWTLGIAATALGEWRRARQAWRDFGLEVDAGSDQPLDGDLGPAPIRVESGAVLWCRRIDPARAVIRSVPRPESGRRCGDLLLHDREPSGARLLDGVELPVLDELARLQASALITFRAVVVAPTVADAVALEQSFGEISGEDWTVNTRSWKAERTFGLAARSKVEVEALLSAWVGGGRQLRGVEEVG